MMNICIYKHKPRVDVTLRILEAYERAFKRQGHSVLVMSQDMERFSSEQALDFAKTFIGFKADLAICYGFSAMPRINGSYFFRKHGIPLALLCFENPFFGLNEELIHEINSHQDYYSFFVWDSFYLRLLEKLFKNCFPIQHAADIPPERSIIDNTNNRTQRDIAFVGNISDFPKIREERLDRGNLPNNLIDELILEKMNHPCINPIELCQKKTANRAIEPTCLFSDKLTNPLFHQQILFPVYREGLGCYRHFLLNHLKMFNIHYYGGVHWPSDHITFHNPVKYVGELTRVYTTTAVNLDIPSFQTIDSLDNRVFDIGGAGAFLLTQKSPQLSELFEEAEKITYEDVFDLEDKIRYYLDNPDNRKAVSERLHRCITEKHTYDHRIPFLVDALKTAHGVG
jgi:hypothetical protein